MNHMFVKLPGVFFMVLCLFSPCKLSLADEHKTNLPQADLFAFTFDTPDAATLSFYAAYTNRSNPGISDEALEKMCKAVSTTSFLSQCLIIFQDRIRYLQDLQATRADFLQPKSSTMKEKNRTKVTWKERLQTRKGKTVENERSMELGLMQINHEWKVNTVFLQDE